MHPGPYICAVVYILFNNFSLVAVSTSQRSTSILTDNIVLDSNRIIYDQFWLLIILTKWTQNWSQLHLIFQAANPKSSFNPPSCSLVFFVSLMQVGIWLAENIQIRINHSCCNAIGWEVQNKGKSSYLLSCVRAVRQSDFKNCRYPGKISSLHLEW